MVDADADLVFVILRIALLIVNVLAKGEDEVCAVIRDVEIIG